MAKGDQAAIPPFIADGQPTLAPALQAATDDASVELARFDAEVGHMVAPFASILLRTESASSSEVENLTSSAKQVALAELGASDSGNAKLVVANVRVMRAALRFADELSVEAIIQMQQTLLEETVPQLTGHLRDQQVWIGGGSISPHDAQFETIHPFPDGNGRTGRALVHSMLRRAGLTRNISVPVSAGIGRS